MARVCTPICFTKTKHLLYLLFQDWGSITEDFRFKVNIGRWFNVNDLIKDGPYNAFLVQCPFYSAKAYDYEKSDKLFKTCFSEGFAFEILEAYASKHQDISWTVMNLFVIGNQVIGLRR